MPYDGGLLGFGLDGAQRFGYAPHVGCVKAVHCNQAGKLATGATDNSVKLFDLARSVELGELQEHEDSVACLQYWQNTLVTGGSDGQVCIWRCGDYELLLKFKGHKAAVTCLAIHPSGRMMASAGRDQRLQLWDLTRGTSAAHLTMEGLEALEWSPDGERIAALSPKELTAVEVKDPSSAASFKDASSAGFMRVSFTAVAWLSPHLLALGDAKGAVRVLRHGAELVEVCQLPETEKGTPAPRVKALLARDGRLLVGMSAGQVEVWGFILAKAAPEFEKLRVVDTKSRLTCLTAWFQAAADAGLKKKQPESKKLVKPAAKAGKTGKAAKTSKAGKAPAKLVGKKQKTP
ncbi:unnamed protein product [Effrenium voratum]|nr:unnamed protein product [Effrenium voratum]